MVATKEYNGVVIRRGDIDLSESRARIESPYDRLFRRVLAATCCAEDHELRKDGFLEVPVSDKNEKNRVTCAMHSRARRKGFRLTSHWNVVRNTVSLRLDKKGGAK